jgi:alkanesulfonate monooxygenase SsuD/methylene tetrahydromethanopterin reductase-like flavin-dependent oxidoreductase (luciferase family)
MLPLQKPHPQIWIPGLLSPETVEWCAKHRYPYVALATFLEPTVELWDFYRDAAAREGYQVGTENFGYLQKIYVAETEEKAHEIAKWDMFGGAGIGYSLFSQPHWSFPPGYNSKAATRRIAKQLTAPRKKGESATPWAGKKTESAESTSRERISGAQVEHRSASWQDKQLDVEATRKHIFEEFSDAERQFQMICGTPKSVLPKIKTLLEVLRPGIFMIWQNDGPISREDRLNNLRLLGQEVVPAIREMGKELDLKSPFEVAPGTRLLAPGAKPESIGSLQPLRLWHEKAA